MTGEVFVSREGDTVTVTLSQPQRRNAITLAMYDMLETALLGVARDETVRALVLRGAGGAFAGGTDIRDLQNIADGEAGVAYEARMWRVQTAFLSLRIPVIAVVDGACVGGGLALAALSDIVYCTPSATFGTPIARTLGNTLSATSLARLQQCFGRRRTAEMVLTGRLLPATEAVESGFVTRMFTPEVLERELADTINRIDACSRLSLWSFKELERRLDAHIATVEVDDVYRTIYGGADFREGVNAFLEKRPAQFARAGVVS